MAIKSINLLPEIFRSETNKKFLAATLDQLTAESQTVRLESYIGRKDAPTYRPKDTYIKENTTARQNYQLEPSVVGKNSDGTISSYTSYQDLLQQISYQGGSSADHSRLFTGESYNFDGLIDLDKFVNFNQYLWLPNGPPEVEVGAGTDTDTSEFDVVRDLRTLSYNFTGYGTDKNPALTLIKGNTYTFTVRQPGKRFWIQTAPGVTGTRSVEAEDSIRTIFGLTDNGEDNGTITFQVPLGDAQNDILGANLAATVDLVTTLSYNQVQNHLITQIPGGIDGVKNSLNGKTVVFINRDVDNALWTDPGNFDADPFDLDDQGFEYGLRVPGEQRSGVFRIRAIEQNGRPLLRLEHIQAVPIGAKIFVRSGTVYANTELLRNQEGYYEELVPVTAPLTELFYQDDSDPLLFGRIKLVNPGTALIDVTADIIGQVNYTSPNGVQLTNGLVIRFDTSVTPEFYRDNSFIVSGVGKAIQLTSIANFLVPEQYASVGLSTPDYITISRGSQDLNAWSRSNRWFHSQVIEKTAEYRRDPTLLDISSVTRAKRPIIEFEPNIYLFNYGQKAKSPVDIIDFLIDNPFKEVEGKQNYVIRMPNGITRQLTPGTRIIFAGADDPDVRNRIYRVDYVITSADQFIHLVSQNTQVLPVYEVTDSFITANIEYNFLPTVTFENPIPVIGAEIATGEVVLKPTGIQSLPIDFGGVNYIADPYLQITSDYTTAAEIDIVYRTFTQIDYIRVDVRGTGYSSTSPAVTIDNPNDYVGFVSSIGLGTSTFELEGVADWDNILPGMQVIGPGIIGGTLVNSVDSEAQIVTLSAPSVLFSFTLGQTGINVVNVGSQFIFKGNTDPGSYAIMASDVSNDTTITVDDTSMLDQGMIVSGGQSPIEISSVIITSVPTRIITTGIHGYQNGDLLLIRGVDGTVELNNTRYYAQRISENVIDLYNDSTLLTPQDSRNFTDYVSGGLITAFTIDYGTTTVTEILSPTQFTVDRSVTLKAGTKLVFGGVTATASARSDGTGVYLVVVTNAGSGYTTQPLVSIADAGGIPAEASAVLSHGVINYAVVTDPGTGYKFNETLSIDVISQATVYTSDTVAYGSNILQFATEEELAVIQPGWIVLLSTDVNGKEIYTDFSQVPYASSATTGPNADNYSFYMDVSKTQATVLTVQSKDADRIVLSGPMYSKDADGEIIDLPVGSKIFFTAQDIFFTQNGDGDSSPVESTVKSTFILADDATETNVIYLESVLGVQPGMVLQDLSNALARDIRVLYVDPYLRSVTLSKNVILTAGVPVKFQSGAQLSIQLAPSSVDYIDITNAGAGYVRAPKITIEPAQPAVTKLASCDGTTVLSVTDFDDIIIGSKVTSQYDNFGIGIETGADIPVVEELFTVQTGSNRFEYRVRLSRPQTVFNDILVTFTRAAEAVALIGNTNDAFVTSDNTPETYEAGDTISVNTPANKSQLLRVASYNQFWYTGTEWLPAQQKTDINQAPQFDAFDKNGYSAGDGSVYQATKFVGTKIIGYTEGTGVPDTVLGIPLQYRNFQNVGDIEFTNYFETQTFNYLSGFGETTKSLNSFTLKQRNTHGGYDIRNVWSKITEPTRQYQIIEHVFDGKTNYFEIDILPIESRTIPSKKVFIENRLLSETTYRIEQYGGRYAVIIDVDQLTEGNRVKIAIHSDSISRLGYYEIPVNFSKNPLNENFATLTLGQIRNHLQEMSSNHYGVVGNILGSNNLRDLTVKGWAGSILQHANPVVMSGLFIDNEDINAVKSITFAQKEYTKFKTRFLDVATKIEINVNDIPASVDAIMVQIMAGKSSQSPWYNSDMLGYNTNQRTVTDIPILNVRQKTYLINETFDPTVISTRSVLVYLRDDTSNLNKQLIYGKDFVFNTQTTSITIMDHIELAYTQRLSVVDYSDTSECYVPATPTKLGLYPRFVPSIYLDNTYRLPINVIQGHDGSLTPAFNDYRDQLLIELELRIYNNIKLEYESNDIAIGAGLADFVPGKYRDTLYNRTQFNQLLAKSFLSWVGSSQLNFSENVGFQNNDPFTWNYGTFKDPSGETLPGYWRGIYKYYYDTDRPHLTPWEMLGFAEQPDWWEARYGSAPYTGGNSVLWSDLENGIIYAGSRQGTDTRFARPGLSNIIPVDENGLLISPQKLMVSQFNSVDNSSPFAVGDFGPVESAWRRSSDFTYAMQIAMALSRPAFYFSALFDTSRYYRNTQLDQLLIKNTQTRITPSQLLVPDTGLISGTPVLTSGYVNWLCDYLVYKGINGSEVISNYLGLAQVNLSYKVGGFTDKKILQVVAEQSSPNGSGHSIIIPDENYKIYLHEGAPLDRLIYSAVIIEKSVNGWKISGYDTLRPYFTIIPSEQSNNASFIDILGVRATIYKDYQLRKATVPYGYELKSPQQVVDFLVAYQRHLLSIGFVFDEYNSELAERQDWVLSAKEFLTWVQQGWKSGSILVLSPAGSKIKTNTTRGVIAEIKNDILGSRLLDQNFTLVKTDSFNAMRDGSAFVATALLGQTIALADLSLIEYEHAIIFDNSTVFNDTIYSPATGNRQARLKLTGYKTSGWTGQLSAPGYMYNSDTVDEWVSRGSYRRGSLVEFKDQYYVAMSNVPESTDFDFSYWRPIDKNNIKTGLLANFSLQADRFRNFYDVDNHPKDEELDKFSGGLIGFRQRDYFQDFDLDNTSQIKFYQGYIKQKGTKSAIDNLTTAIFDNIDSEISFYEEWALRVGEYGSAGADQYMEIVLNEIDFSNNPTTFSFINRDDVPAAGIISFTNADIYRSSEPVYNKNLIQYRTDRKPRINDNVTSGYVRLDDIDGTIYNIEQYPDYYDIVSTMGSGFKLWTAVDFNKSWNVYRATETDVQIISLRLISNNVLVFTFNAPHGVYPGNLVAIKNFGTNRYFDGFYVVKSVVDNTSITVDGYRNLDLINQTRLVDTVTGVFFRMVSVRYKTVREIIEFVPPHGWRNNDRVWVDNDTDTSAWGVYQKTDGWKFNQLLPLREGDDRSFEGFGSEIKINNDNQIILTGTPGYNTGSLVGLRVINPGQGYESPAVIIDAPTGTPGTLAQFSVTKSNGELLFANVITSGSGYTVAPNISISDTYSATLQSNTFNNFDLEFTAEDLNYIYLGDSVEIENFINGYSVTDIDISANTVTIAGESISFTSATAVDLSALEETVIFTVSTVGLSLVEGLGLRAYMFGDSGSYVQGYIESFTDTTVTMLVIDSVGTGSATSWTLVTQLYVTAGTDVTFVRGSFGTLSAELTATTLDSIQIINSGSGFVLTPQVQLVGGGGIGAKATVALSGGSIESVTITDPGSGYTSAPAVVLLTNNPSSVDLRAKLTPTSVSRIIITNKGQDYRDPVISLIPSTLDGGYGAQIAITNFYGNAGIQTISVTNGGRLYSANTYVTLDNIGSGEGFSANVVVAPNGLITGVTVTNPGSGYSTETIATITSTGGTGATASLSRTQDGIADFTGANITNLGQGYLRQPNVRVIDQGGGGSGAIVEAIFPTGQVKTFLRPDQNKLGIEQTELIKSFSNDAREFGKSIDIGTLKAAIGAPGSFREQGSVLICRSLGSQWVSSQLLFPPDLVEGDRFGHSVAISNDEQWVYVGAPGGNTVYCYGKRSQTNTRIRFQPITNITNYITPLLGLRTAYEVKVLGEDGRLYEPIFDYDIDNLGNIYFADYARIATQNNIYVTRQRLSTTIIPTVLRNILQRTYELDSQPDSIDQMLVFGATGRVFVPNKEYTIVGQQIVFLDDNFANEPSIIVSLQDVFFELTEVITPPDDINEDANFGWSVRCDNQGYNIIVGAPDTDDEVAGAGRVYTFNRSYEVYTTSGTRNIFTLSQVRNVISVSLDNQVLAEFIDYIVEGSSIVLSATPRTGARLKIDTNFFNTVQIIPCPTKINQGKFGYSVDISPDNKNLAVGSPGYRDDVYYNGTVYRYVNKGLTYGAITSSLPAANVTSVLGETIIINDKVITFQQSAGDLEIIKLNLQAGDLVAVDVNVVNDRLTISIASGTALQTLDIQAGVGTVLANIGLEIYGLTQTLYHPRYGVPERFGVNIRIDDTGNTLAISSEGGNTLKTSTFDTEGTVFDADTTRFIDSLNASGAVYMYDYLSPPGETFDLPGRLLYNQVLQNSYILTGDNFGSAIDINKGWAVVGSSKSNFYSEEAGLVHVFINDGDIKGWSKLRERGEVVDIDYINRVVAYNTTTQTTVDQLDYYDPVKGKILGIADQDIDYKSSYDPAYYNRSTSESFTVSTDTNWNEVQVGSTWWDLSLCRFIDYEQGETAYRSKHWGELFPESVIEVCEWVQSLYLPSEYANNEGDGVAKYENDSAYVEENYYDAQTSLIKTRYYYWVKGKRNFDRTKIKRNNSVVAIEQIIRDPLSQSVSYIAAVSPNSFNLYNASQYIKSTDIVLRIEYSRVLSDIISHSEYQLIQQGNPLDSIPSTLVSKLIDSLSGENAVGQVVPDLSLPAPDAYGTAMLPRQSMIKNGPEATRVFVTFVNNVLMQSQIVELKNLYRFNLAEEIPPTNVGFYHIVIDSVDQLNYIPASDLFDGFKVLVLADADFFNYWTIYEYVSSAIGWRMIRIQSYDTRRWWHYVDWYATGYDKYTSINHVVTRYADTVRVLLKPGQIVKVMNDYQGNYALYLVENTGALTKVARQNGTIQLNNSLYDYNLSFTGFDNAAFDQVGFSTTQSSELRNLFEGLVYDIFIDADRVQTNNLFFTLLNYILSEQTAIDWALKTSLISVIHKIRKLQQFPNYIRDNQDYYQGYINEVKPYRTQIREYLLDYQGLEETNVGVSDFDMPTVFDRNVMRYRPLDYQNAKDLAIIVASDRNAWYKNYAYSIQDIVLISGGAGYIQAPTVSITGGGGSGATATAIISGLNENGTASIIQLVLTNAGTGYTSTPVVEFIGGVGNGAKATVVLQDSVGAITINTVNRKIRNVMTTIKFDRISYTSEIRVWKPYEHYKSGDIIVVPDVRLTSFANYSERQLPRYNNVYRVIKPLLGANTIDLNVFEDPTIVEALPGDYFENANDRLAAYFQPSSPNSAKIFNTPDLVRLVPVAVNDEIVSVAQQWNSIAHSIVVPAQHEYKFAAVGDRSLIALSEDGVDWITVTIADTGVNTRDIALYKGEQWIAVGNQGSIFYTNDGAEWFRESIDSYRYSPTSDNNNGLLQQNVAQALDMTGVAHVESTFSNYLVVVGNNGLILCSPRGNSQLKADWNEWHRLSISGLNITQNYLKVIAVNLGNLQNVDGTEYNVSIQPVSGYHVESTVGVYNKAKLGYIITVGVNGAINMISYMNLDDVMQGYITGYNYNIVGTGKQDNLDYPWLKLSVPASVRGLSDGFSGEQINQLAVSGDNDGTNRWMVAVGSHGTLLWNKFDTSLRIRDGRSELAADTIGRTVVDHTTHAFNNFREFDADNFVAPLTPAQLTNINLNDITWDGEKFVVLGNSGLIIWGYPGVNPEAYINITDITGAVSVASRRPTATWNSVTDGTSLTIQILSSDIEGAIIVPGMTVYHPSLPDDAVVSATALNESGYWLIDIEFAENSVSAVTEGAITFAYVLTQDIIAGAEIIATDDNGNEQILTISQNAAKGATRIYIDNFAEQVQANWLLSGTGMPTGARIQSIGKFAQFLWQLATGNQLSTTLDYRALAVNSTIFTISQPLQQTDRGIIAGDTIVCFDPTGTRIEITATETLRANVTSICVNTVDLRILDAGYQIEANVIMGIANNTTVVSTENYVLGGVVSKLEKDIPGQVPGTSYSGAKVTGQVFTDTATDSLSLDTDISSLFTDSLLGQRPEDIVVDGGLFIDRYSSHAPEELVPGQLIDSLQMNVFTANVVNGTPDYTDIIGYKIFTDYRQPTVYYRLADANTTELAVDLAYDDLEIEVVDISKLPDPNPDGNILGSVWINGEKINYLGIDRANNRLTNIRRGAQRTSIPVLHQAGQLVVDATTEQFIGQDTELVINENTTVVNGIIGGSNSATYLSATVTSIAQSTIWQDLT